MVGCGPEAYSVLAARTGADRPAPGPGRRQRWAARWFQIPPAPRTSTAARESTTVDRNQAPAAVTVLSEADVNRMFGDVLSALPPAPEQFVLYFRFESDDADR